MELSPYVVLTNPIVIAHIIYYLVYRKSINYYVRTIVVSQDYSIQPPSLRATCVKVMPRSALKTGLP